MLIIRHSNVTSQCNLKNVFNALKIDKEKSKLLKVHSRITDDENVLIESANQRILDMIILWKWNLSGIVILFH